MKRLQYLDGIRGLCALWVVLSHLWIRYEGSAPHAGVIGLLTNWLLYAHFAVDVFIVLSGYCLALQTPGDPLVFMKKRAIRILPCVYAALIISLIVRLALDHNEALLSPAILLPNLLLFQDVQPPANIIDTPLWSVAVEWRIYFLFPIILAISKIYRREIVLGGVCLLAFGLSLLDGLQIATPWYLALFGFGVYARGAEHKGKAIWLLGAGGCLSIAYITTHLINTAGLTSMEFPVVDTLVGMTAAAALVVCRGATFLELPPLVFLGKISFSLYLIHSPAILIISHVLKHYPAPFVAISWIVGLPLVILASTIFYSCVEAPSMKWLKTIPGERLRPSPESTPVSSVGRYWRWPSPTGR